MRNTPCRPLRGGFGARPGVRAPGDGKARVEGPYRRPWCCCWPTGGGRGGASILRPRGRRRRPHARRWVNGGVPWPVGRPPVPVGGAAAAVTRKSFSCPPDCAIRPIKQPVNSHSMEPTARSMPPSHGGPGGSWLQSTPGACRGQPSPHWRPPWRSEELPLRRTSEPARGEQQFEPSYETCDQDKTSRRSFSNLSATTWRSTVPTSCGGFALCSN